MAINALSFKFKKANEIWNDTLYQIKGYQITKIIKMNKDSIE